MSLIKHLTFERQSNKEKIEHTMSAPPSTPPRTDVTTQPTPPPVKPTTTTTSSSSQQEFETEIKELESIPTTGTANYFASLFPSNIYDSFGSILTFARELNVQIPSPEFVFCGTQNSGKSAILEAIIGHAINHVNNVATDDLSKLTLDNIATKRPLFINLVNNKQVKEKPKVTVRRDLSQLTGLDSKNLEADWVCEDFTKLSDELRRRLSKFSNVPVYVQVEHESFLNVTFIDTPGLNTNLLKEDKVETDDISAKKIEETVLSLLRPSHRQIVCVEQSNDWTQLQMFNIVKKVDPSMTRTTLVYSKFHNYLKTHLNATIKVNRYLAGKPRDSNQVFFVSLFSSKVRSSNLNSDKFQEKVFQAYQLDRSVLDTLQFDKRFSENIGIHNLRREIQQNAWKSYQARIPEILKRLRGLKRDTGAKLEKLRNLLQSLDSSRLRTTATNYVVYFLQIIEKLIAGTAEANPSVTGQTALEEKNYGVGEWFDSNYQEIKVDPVEWKIPYYDTRLYGGQQFERLIAEFKAVVDHTKITDVSMDDIATASGLNRLNNLPNFAYAACDIAQSKVRDSLVTLIDQLCKRAVYIMKRLSQVASKIMESRRKNAQQTNSGVSFSTDLLEASDDDFNRFPYFIYHVKDLYNEFVDQTSELVRNKCNDEFYCTAAIYWDISEMTDLSAHIPKDISDMKQVKDSVVNLSSKIFDDLKSRIAKNVMLKFYNFFLIPMQTSLWNTIQGTVTCLSDSALAEIFEVNAVKEKLLEDEKVLKNVLDRCVSQEESFLRESTIFSHPVQHKNLVDKDDEDSTSYGSSPSSFQRSGPPPSILGGF
jgi:hypothetical protein